MELEEKEYYSELYDIYKELLTEKQQIYFEAYYFNDYSISEIAESYLLSRNGVFDQIKKTVKLLEEYEKKLKLLEKRNLRLEVIKSLEEKGMDLSELKKLD